MFGGNSNWRGPIWFPVNALMIRALLNLYVGYGDDFTVECPTGSGVRMTLFEVAREISDRLTGSSCPARTAPALLRRPGHLRHRELARSDHVLRVLPRRQRRGPGRRHQTGWTGLAAVFPTLFARLSGPDLLEHGMTGVLAALDEEEP
jgi:hypothetical protein